MDEAMEAKSVRCKVGFPSHQVKTAYRLSQQNFGFCSAREFSAVFNER